VAAFSWAEASGTSSTAPAAGGVTDFIAIGPWPPFNVADIAITSGAALLVLALILSSGDD
jgi:lipoprotein signal peptidase